MQSADDWKAVESMSVYRDRGTWRYRKWVKSFDGTKIRIGGSAPQNENTKAKATELLEEHSRQVREPPKEDSTGRNAGAGRVAPTANEFWPVYIDACRAKGLAKGTIENRKRDFARHILPVIGELRLPEVTYAVLEALWATLAKTQPASCNDPDRVLSLKTVFNLQLHVCNFLKRAKKHKWIDSVPDIEWVKVPESEFDYLSFAEAHRMLSVPRDEWRTMILVAMRTGLRFGELLALRWVDVDFDRRQIAVRQNYVKGEFKAPKGGRTRYVPMTPDVVTDLTIHRHARGPLVFCDFAGNVLSRHPPVSALESRLRMIGLGDRGLGWHDLRHTYASHLVMSGVDIYVVQRLLGHRSIKTTERYVHLAPDFVQSAALALERHTSAPGKAPTITDDAMRDAVQMVYRREGAGWSASPSIAEDGASQPRNSRPPEDAHWQRENASRNSDGNSSAEQNERDSWLDLTKSGQNSGDLLLTN
jgi:integrase